DQGNPRAGLGLERDLAEDRPTILVAENDPAIGDAPNKSCRPLMRLASPAAFNRLIENFADALGTGCSAGGEVGQLAQVAHRLVELLAVEEEHGQTADRDAALRDGQAEVSEVVPASRCD